MRRPTKRKGVGTMARKIGFGLMVVVLAMGVTNAQEDMKGWYVGVGAGSAACGRDLC